MKPKKDVLQIPFFHVNATARPPPSFQKPLKKGVLQQDILRFQLSQSVRQFFYFVFVKSFLEGYGGEICFPQEMSLAIGP